jgi:hypothetical protein
LDVYTISLSCLPQVRRFSFLGWCLVVLETPQNLMFLNNETSSLSWLYFNIWAMVEAFGNYFSPACNAELVKRYPQRPLTGKRHEYWWTCLLLWFFTLCQPHQRYPS